ncbi:M23 family metallopeptidase [Corynebacterium sanguinis]|uniref:M23 family metallopeptidase n=1 Tax=Corynebacterium sanguinis TaxID=2594913 RepID=A0A6C1TVB9_9CORY|nr:MULTISPECIES: M23 family metallopeptidase [Corynebacterium]MBA4505241.1 M23 family metallopeptidase [Corynebacterium sanguinis]MCT1411766.1 M23 family metallopeptidase [Corynebacterium sanguinis]MCT1413704.1 M23 family metallopeptidase [Corynebacterium sanguinis]MCT1425298.1 M23 family metallopeptidase [Corynebacterium sanguinis]MCT1444296.1 M23 family metallopeptidase [Corynebacterium sanguinis]
MYNSTKARTGGKHRKQSPNKGRVALVAVATGAVSTAGVSGAAAAALQSDKASEPTVDFELAADADAVDTQLSSADAAPQILAIAEYKPVENLSDQLNKAVQHSELAAKADELLRAPSSVKPAEGAFTSGFGPRWGAFHAGIDIANVTNTPILAVLDGTVLDSGPAQGYGQWIRLLHDDGTITVYGHMETLDVAVGERVKAGQKIAGMGNRGFSTGTHLHFEVHPNGADAVDPVPWLAALGITV